MNPKCPECGTFLKAGLTTTPVIQTTDGLRAVHQGPGMLADRADGSVCPVCRGGDVAREIDEK